MIMRNSPHRNQCEICVDSHYGEDSCSEIVLLEPRSFRIREYPESCAGHTRNNASAKESPTHLSITVYDTCMLIQLRYHSA